MEKSEVKELLEEAINNLDTMDENKFEELTESLFTSMSMRSRDAKMNAVIGAVAVSIAKSKNDVLYGKLKKYKTLWKNTKDQIVQKYGNMAKQKWLENQKKKKS